MEPKAIFFANFWIESSFSRGDLEEFGSELVCSLDLDRERVDALAPLEERLGRGVDPLVPRDEEVIDTEEVDDLEDRVAVREQAPKHLLLGGFVEGDLAVRADVDHAE